MTNPIEPGSDYVHPYPQALAGLTQALEKIIQETAISSPQVISVFFDGTEVYRQKTQDGSVFWWKSADDSTQSITHPTVLFSSH